MADGTTSSLNQRSTATRALNTRSLKAKILELSNRYHDAVPCNLLRSYRPWRGTGSVPCSLTCFCHFRKWWLTRIKSMCDPAWMILPPNHPPLTTPHWHCSAMIYKLFFATLLFPLKGALIRWRANFTPKVQLVPELPLVDDLQHVSQPRSLVGVLRRVNAEEVCANLHEGAWTLTIRASLFS